MGVPGVLHQGILSLFRDDPWLGHDIVGRERPVDVTPIDRRADIDLPTDDPKKVTIRHLDLVLVARDPNDYHRGVAMNIETQRDFDPNKYWRVCSYQGALQDIHQLPALLVYVSFSRRVSLDARSWATRPGMRIDLLLIDADTVPPIPTLEAALARPTAAVLVGALHGCRGNLAAARMGIAACRDLPERTRDSYNATILAALPEAERSLVMEEMDLERPNPLWEIERRSGTYLLGLKNGRSEGRSETLVEMILAILELRGLDVDPTARARVSSCDSLDTLEDWARRAREVGHVDELFEPAPDETS